MIRIIYQATGKTPEQAAQAAIAFWQALPDEMKATTQASTTRASATAGGMSDEERTLRDTYAKDIGKGFRLTRKQKQARDAGELTQAAIVAIIRDCVERGQANDDESGASDAKGETFTGAIDLSDTGDD